MNGLFQKSFEGPEWVFDGMDALSGNPVGVN
jgi:hypothetical protein